MNMANMDRQKLIGLYKALAELEAIERRLEDWRSILDDPETRFGYHDHRGLSDSSRRISVVIRENWPDYGPKRDNPSIDAEFWSEKSIRQAIELFMQGLQDQAGELRKLLITNGIDPASPSVGAWYDYDDLLDNRWSNPR